MIPKELKPKCHKIYIKMPEETEANKTTEAKSKTKRKSVRATNSPVEAKQREKKRTKARPKKGNQRKSGASAIESDEEKVSCYDLLAMWLKDNCLNLKQKRRLTSSITRELAVNCQS